MPSFRMSNHKINGEFMEDTKLVKDLMDLCIDKVTDRFKGFAKIESCTHEETNLESVPDRINFRSEILLYGVDLTMRFQFFFNLDDQANYLSKIFDELNEKRIIDFYNEVANLTGGKIKEVLYEQNIVTGLSLPVSVKTSKRKIKSSGDVLSHSNIWSISKNEESIFWLKSSIEVHKPEAFKVFNKDFKKIDIEDGDIDFF